MANSINTTTTSVIEETVKFCVKSCVCSVQTPSGLMADCVRVCMCASYHILLLISFVPSYVVILLVRLDLTSCDVRFNFHVSQMNLSHCLMMTHGGDN